MSQISSVKTPAAASQDHNSTSAASTALIAVFAALLAAFSLLPGFTIGPVPFSMTIIIVLLTPLLLGAWQGFLATLLYIVAGIAGLPVFAGGASGIAVLQGPTGGYLIGYLLCSLVGGSLATLVLGRRATGPLTFIGLTASALVGLAVLHAAGVAGLMINAGMGLNAALTLTLGFVPLDLVKTVLAGSIAMTVIRAFPRLAGRRRA